MQPSSPARFLHPVVLLLLFLMCIVCIRTIVIHLTIVRREVEKATPTEGLHSSLCSVKWKEITNALIDLSHS